MTVQNRTYTNDETVADISKIKPCPFCGGGETYAEVKRLSPTMRGPGAIICICIRHHCIGQETPPRSHHHYTEVTGRDFESALAGWNRRPPGE